MSAAVFDVIHGIEHIQYMGTCEDNFYLTRILAAYISG